MAVAIRSVRRIRTNTWMLLLASVVWLAVNVRWVAIYRQHGIVDVDEASYLSLALNDHYAAVRDGFGGWVAAVWWPGISAPLVPALTSLQFFVTGTGPTVALAVPLFAGLATVLLTYGLANRLGGRALAWPALLLIATAPGVLLEARAYHFGVPAMAVAMAALYCLVRSERLSSTGFSVAFGVFLGLMPLTRTMTIAFAPGLVLAALLQVTVGPDRRRRLIHCAVALAVAVGVASTWLVSSGPVVFRYLTEFGYGQQSAEYGTAAGVFNPAAWLARLHTVLAEQYLPHTLVLCVGLISASYLALRRARSDGTRSFLELAVTSPAMPVMLVVAEGLAAFVSSRTNGNGYTLLLTPAMVVVAVWGLHRAHPRLRRALPAVAAVVGLIAAVPALDLRAPTGGVWTMDLPGVGRVKVTDGRGTAQIYAGLDPPTEAREPVSAETARQWSAASDWAAQQIVDNNALGGTTAFGVRDRMFNTSTVQLAMLRKKGYGVAMAQIRPVEIGNTLADHQRWLTRFQDSLSGDASTACLLFTATGTVDEFPPPVDPAAMARAAQATGFTARASHPLPNGRVLTLWWRPRPECA
ncbi:MAG TPA: glycosyltransferase family 39 protein [Actinophytocola sp.]|uniref:glycosyltransferase family 39 protein n=1 Tax=Actinophytocola sp. TaxID=1872138 RepID=UPI002DDD622D|nr:glycosyltransferase family 39 protein [Actinophytocola sp.]HEV2781502.1 glycosyltransferase family 39 protein [Actinophytocola sp.]